METHDQIDLTHTASDHAHQVRAFQVHAGVFVATMVLIFAVNLATNLAAGITGQWSAWWSAWALIGWSMGLAVHGLVVFLANPRTGRESTRTS
jgi:2TM domain